MPKPGLDTRLISSASESEVFREHRKRTWSSKEGSGPTAATHDGTTSTRAAPVDALSEEAAWLSFPLPWPLVGEERHSRAQWPFLPHLWPAACRLSSSTSIRYAQRTSLCQFVGSSADDWVPDVLHATKVPAALRCRIPGMSLEILPPVTTDDPTAADQCLGNLRSHPSCDLPQLRSHLPPGQHLFDGKQWDQDSRSGYVYWLPLQVTTSSRDDHCTLFIWWSGSVQHDPLLPLEIAFQFFWSSDQNLGRSQSISSSVCRPWPWGQRLHPWSHSAHRMQLVEGVWHQEVAKGQRHHLWLDIPQAWHGLTCSTASSALPLSKV